MSYWRERGVKKCIKNHKIKRKTARMDTRNSKKGKTDSGRLYFLLYCGVYMPFEQRRTWLTTPRKNTFICLWGTDNNRKIQQKIKTTVKDVKGIWDSDPPTWAWNLSKLNFFVSCERSEDNFEWDTFIWSEKSILKTSWVFLSHTFNV